MKRTIAWFLTLALLLSCSPMLRIQAQAEETESAYIYTVSGGAATITGCTDSLSGDITIPATLGGYPVTAIGNFAFSDNLRLTSVVIPESVSAIGMWAFGFCSNLTNVVIPEGVTYIGDDAFCSCTSLKEVAIPSSVTSIGTEAFGECSALEKVTLGSNVTFISDFAFRNCEKLTEVVIPEGVTYIGGYAFYSCTGLTKVTIPASVTTVGSSAFQNCPALEEVNYGGSATQWEQIGIGGNNEALTGAAVTTVELASIAVKTAPVKTNYWVGEELDATGLVITATYSNDTTADLTEGFTLTGFDSAEAGTKTVTVTYLDKTVTFDVTVNAITLTGIAIKTAPTKTVYWTGEALDTTGLVITATYSNDTTADLTEGFTFTGFDSAEAGTKTVTATYLDKTVTFDVTVNAITLTGITIKTAPTKTVYQTDEELDTTGLVITATYSNDTTADLTEGFTFTGFDSTSEGTKTVTVTYLDKTVTFDVTVLPAGIRGDLDGNEAVDEDDAIYLLQHVLMPGTFPVEQPMDLDGNGTVDEDDAIYLLQHVLMPETFPL